MTRFQGVMTTTSGERGLIRQCEYVKCIITSIDETNKGQIGGLTMWNLTATVATAKEY